MFPMEQVKEQMKVMLLLIFMESATFVSLVEKDMLM